MKKLFFVLVAITFVFLLNACSSEQKPAPEATQEMKEVPKEKAQEEATQKMQEEQKKEMKEETKQEAQQE